MSGFNDEILAALPIEFWDYFTFNSPNTYGDYQNLWWLEWVAINHYIALADKCLINAVISNQKLNMSEDMRRFIIGMKRPPRTKKTTLPRDIDIYYEIKRRPDGTSKNNAVANTARRRNKSIFTINSAYSNGKKAVDALNAIMEKDIIKHYLDWRLMDDAKIDHLIEKYHSKAEK